MNLIFAKLYEKYSKKQETKNTSISLYISICYLFLSLLFLFPIKIFLEKNGISLNRTSIYSSLFVIYTFTYFCVYHIYIKKKRIQKLTRKFRSIKISTFTLYACVIAIPPFLLLLAGVSTKYLFE